MVAESQIDNTLLKFRGRIYRLCFCRFTEQEAIYMQEQLKAQGIDTKLSNDEYNGKTIYRVWGAIEGYMFR